MPFQSIVSICKLGFGSCTGHAPVICVNKSCAQVHCLMSTAFLGAWRARFRGSGRILGKVGLWGHRWRPWAHLADPLLQVSDEAVIKLGAHFISRCSVLCLCTRAAMRFLSRICRGESEDTGEQGCTAMCPGCPRLLATVSTPAIKRARQRFGWVERYQVSRQPGATLGPPNAKWLSLPRHPVVKGPLRGCWMATCQK